MAKSGNLKGKRKQEAVLEELQEFNKLIKGHKKLLLEIGRL